MADIHSTIDKNKAFLMYAKNYDWMLLIFRDSQMRRVQTKKRTYSSRWLE